MNHVLSGPDADVWTDVVDGALPDAEMARWAVRRDCGAVVTFTGTARDHSADRPAVTELHYEAYLDGARQAVGSVAEETRRRWPTVGRIGIVHRVGEVPLGESAVVVVVSAPHRSEAFEAARFAIDALKESVPIWKRERWAGGDDWGREAAPIVAPGEVS